MKIARPTWFKVGISLVFWSSWFLIVFASNSRTLQKIEVLSLGGSEEIHLSFDKEFLEEPKINFESGNLILYLDSVQKNPQIPSKIILKENTLIKEVRTIQAPGRDSLHLNFKLNSAFSLDDTEIKHYEKNLILILQNSFSSTPLLSSNKVLMQEIEQRIKNDDSLLSSFSNFAHSASISDEGKDINPLQIDNWGETILTLVASLIFVLLSIYFIAFLYKRFFSSRFSSMKGKVSIRQISSYYVGPKQKVIVFDFNGRMFACGVTPSSINLISELYEESEIGSLHSGNESQQSLGKEGNESKSNFIKTLEPELKKIKRKDIFELDQKLELEKTTENNDEFKGLFIDNSSNDFEKLSNSNVAKSGVTSKKTLNQSTFVSENFDGGNKSILDFAAKLTKRIKFLRPIK